MALRPNSVSAIDAAHHLHGYTNLRKNEQEGPMVLSRGKGIHVYDENGKEYIEGLAGLWCAALGFDAEDRVVEAAAKQMRQLAFYHSFSQKTHEPAALLAQRLAAILPMDRPRIYFASSGSEANDTTVKMVWYYHNGKGQPQKKKIIARQKGYHGVTVAAASLTGLPYVQNDFDVPIARIFHTGAPHFYRHAEPGESEEAFVARRARELEELILKEGPETIGAFIGEPLQGAGGVIVPAKGYWQAIQPILKKYDILLIADEVICGFGRTGNWFGSETFGIQPDIMTMAKQLSAAFLPMSAVAVNDKVFQGLADKSAANGNFGQGYTYSAHPVVAAVALEVQKIYQERDIVSHAKRVGAYMQDQLRQRFAHHPLVGEVRGIGLIAAVELVADKETKRPFSPIGKVGPWCVARLQEHGVILRAMQDSCCICPPLIITESQVDQMLDRFEKALTETAAWVETEKLRQAA